MVIGILEEAAFCDPFHDDLRFSAGYRCPAGESDRCIRGDKALICCDIHQAERHLCTDMVDNLCQDIFPMIPIYICPNFFERLFSAVVPARITADHCNP